MSDLRGRKNEFGWKFLGVIRRSGIHIYTYVMKSKTKPKKIYDFQEFLPFLLKLFKFPWLAPLSPHDIAGWDPSIGGTKTTPRRGGLDAQPQTGRHTRLSFKALALLLQGMVYVAVCYSILRIEDCNCYWFAPHSALAERRRAGYHTVYFQ